ncbi:hypothetical protein Tco_1003931 [Tanacetum coccineum]|uniref:DUF1204 domain-containing protein n=1 Tax=Tanacetum coccineum TaxID=301880 RepID=A0ABQ5FBT1_9ASTR
MSAKDSIAIQTCELSKEEFNDVLALYSIPSSYHVILPKSNQTVLDAPSGYVRLYTHSFSLANLRPSILMGTWLIMTCDLSGWPGNFVYDEDEEDLSFLPKEPSPACGTNSPSVLVNIEPLMTGEEPVLQPAEAMTDSRGSPKRELFVVHPGSVAACMKNRKYKTRGGSSRPPVKRKLAPGSSTARASQQRPAILVCGKEMAFRNFVYAEDEEDLSFLPKETSSAFGTGSPSVSEVQDRGSSIPPSRPPVKRKLAPGSSTARAKTSTSKDDVSFLTISDEDATTCHLKISAITSPAWKNHLDNYIDLELLDLHDRSYARQAFVDNAMNRRSRELLGVIVKLKGECDMIKERERARDKESEGLQAKCEATMSDFEKNPTMVALKEKISTLSSEVVSLEAEKARLEAVKVSFRKEVDDVRRDRMEVISKVVPYAAMELIYSYDLGSLVGKLVTSAIVYGRCKAFEQVAAMKEPFDLTKVKGYHPSAPVEVLLSKKPPSIQNPAPSKTQALVTSSQKATSSSVLAFNMMYLPADTFVVKPSSF